jgi:hypothetical protein
MIVNINMMNFWNLMLYSLVDRYQNVKDRVASIFIVKV